MATYVAFLRGMNLGKNRRITNADLKAACERVGLEGVETFRASGNVIFEAADGEDREELSARLEAGLGEELGYEVPVFLRTGDEVAAIAAAEPFTKERVEASKGKLQIALLPDRPGKLARKEALSLATDADLLAIEGSELYWLPSGGTIESSLDQRTLDADLGPWTMRTMGTIQGIASKYCG